MREPILPGVRARLLVVVWLRPRVAARRREEDERAEVDPQPAARRENAQYAVSCAHKAGCTMFMGWRDIVQVQPRMILCLFAATMSLDLQRHQTSVI